MVILTTAGGWGVVTADAVTRDRDLRLLDLPDDLLAAIDTKLPPRWSKNNPVDCAGGETRDTIPDVMGLIAGHPAVDAIIYLGLGIQSNQARMMREGGFHPDHGLDRIVAYHERQDTRFAEAAAELSDETDKPILVATELAVADPDNAGPAAVRATGRLCYPERRSRRRRPRPPLPVRAVPGAAAHRDTQVRNHRQPDRRARRSLPASGAAAVGLFRWARRVRRRSRTAYPSVRAPVAAHSRNRR